MSSHMGKIHPKPAHTYTTDHLKKLLQIYLIWLMPEVIKSLTLNFLNSKHGSCAKH